MFDEAGAALGPVTGLVNNAGVTGGKAAPLADVDVADIRRVMEVNVVGCMLCAREAVRRMSTERGGKGGTIVNVSSIAAARGSPGERVYYAASKGALNSFTVGLAQEVAPQGIRVNAVSPGLTTTEMTNDRRRVLADRSVPAPAIRLLELLPSHPIVTMTSVEQILETSKPTATRAVTALQRLGILTERTGRRRARSFGYTAYLDALRAGTELEEPSPLG